MKGEGDGEESVIEHCLFIQNPSLIPESPHAACFARNIKLNIFLYKLGMSAYLLTEPLYYVCLRAV